MVTKQEENDYNDGGGYVSQQDAEKEERPQEVKSTVDYDPFPLGVVSSATRDLCVQIQDSSNSFKLDYVPTEKGLCRIDVFRCVGCRNGAEPRSVPLMFVANCSDSWTGDIKMMSHEQKIKETTIQAKLSKGTRQKIQFSNTSKRRVRGVVLDSQLIVLPVCSMNYVPGFPCTIFSRKQLKEDKWELNNENEAFNIQSSDDRVVTFSRRTMLPGENVEIDVLKGVPVKLANGGGSLRAIGGDVLLPKVMTRILMNQEGEKKLKRHVMFPLEHYCMEVVDGRSKKHIYPLLVFIDNLFRFDLTKRHHLFASIFGCTEEGAQNRYIQYEPDCRYSSITEGMLDRITFAGEKEGEVFDPAGHQLSFRNNKEIQLVMSKVEESGYSVSWEGGESEWWTKGDTEIFTDKHQQEVKTYPLRMVRLPLFSNGRKVTIECVIVPSPTLWITLAPDTISQLRATQQLNRTSQCSCFAHSTDPTVSTERFPSFLHHETTYAPMLEEHRTTRPAFFKFVLNGDCNEVNVEGNVPRRCDDKYRGDKWYYPVNGEQRFGSMEVRLDDGEELYNIFDNNN